IIGPDTLTDLSSVPDPGVIKCDSGGNFIWASQASNFKKSDSTNGAYLNGIAADNTGACYVTGYFTGIFNYGKYRLVAPDTALPTIFFAKYNLAGHLEWIKQSQNPNWTACVACSDAYDNIYVAGTGVGDTLEISGTKIAKTGGGSSLTSAFLAKFDTAGNVECGSILNGGGTVFKIGDQIIGLASNPSGSNVYMGGVLGSSPVYTATDTLVNSGPASPYVVRWRNCGSDEGINEAAAPNNSVLVYPNPNNGRFTIELEGISERSTVEIYNVLGEKVYSCTLNMQQSAHSINISGQAQGMYLYRVISENGNCLGEGKVIIEN
ncbi:MAG TPA: T9SS type A sorting domain-containing protein, partial [Bacteroidia bacterium]|nr:T9SS type A sorting domain-containing protein [Bacteroidia bacterium]